MMNTQNKQNIKNTRYNLQKIRTIYCESLCETHPTSIFDKINDDVFKLIMDYISRITIDTILTRIKYFCERYILGLNNSDRQLNRRVDVLNKNINYESRVIFDEFDKNIVDPLLLTICNNENDILNFLIELMEPQDENSIGDFYIGGSMAMLLADSLLNNVPINISNYECSDIDIFIISQKNLSDIENHFCHVANKSFSTIQYAIYYQNNCLFNFVFQNEKYRKIQVVFHVKKNMDEHMEFIDLSVTQFILTIDKTKYETKYKLFYTMKAKNELQNKIITLYEPLNRATENRIEKYVQKGFIVSILTPYGRPMKIYDIYSGDDYCVIKKNCNLHYKNYKTPNMFYHYVDCTFDFLKKIRENFPFSNEKNTNKHTSANVQENKNIQYITCMDRTYYKYDIFSYEIKRNIVKKSSTNLFHFLNKHDIIIYEKFEIIKKHMSHEGRMRPTIYHNNIGEIIKGVESLNSLLNSQIMDSYEDFIVDETIKLNIQQIDTPAYTKYLDDETNHNYNNIIDDVKNFDKNNPTYYLRKIYTREIFKNFSQFLFNESRQEFLIRNGVVFDKITESYRETSNRGMPMKHKLDMKNLLCVIE